MHQSNNKARSFPVLYVVAAHTLLFCKLFKLTSGCLCGVLNSLMNGYDLVVVATTVIWMYRPETTDLEGFNSSNYLF